MRVRRTWSRPMRVPQGLHAGRGLRRSRLHVRVRNVRVARHLRQPLFLSLWMKSVARFCSGNEGQLLGRLLRLVIPAALAIGVAGACGKSNQDQDGTPKGGSSAAGSAGFESGGGSAGVTEPRGGDGGTSGDTGATGGAGTGAVGGDGGGAGDCSADAVCEVCDGGAVCRGMCSSGCSCEQPGDEGCDEGSRCRDCGVGCGLRCLERGASCPSNCGGPP